MVAQRCHVFKPMSLPFMLCQCLHNETAVMIKVLTMIFSQIKFEYEAFINKWKKQYFLKKCYM